MAHQDRGRVAHAERDHEGERGQVDGDLMPRHLARARAIPSSGPPGRTRRTRARTGTRSGGPAAASVPAARGPTPRAIAGAGAAADASRTGPPGDRRAATGSPSWPRRSRARPSRGIGPWPKISTQLRPALTRLATRMEIRIAAVRCSACRLCRNTMNRKNGSTPGASRTV